jgi:hypothetical protein
LRERRTKKNRKKERNIGGKSRRKQRRTEGKEGGKK